MKPRKWIVIVAFFAFASGTIIYQGVTFLEKNGKIERLIMQAVSSATGGECSVERVKIGFLSAYLENVKLSLATHYYTVTIRDIKVGFSLLKLVRSRGNLGRSISTIILINPKLDIYVNEARRALAQGAPAIGEPSWGLSPVRLNMAHILKNIPLEQFLIRKGTVCVHESQSEGLVVGEDLSGSLRYDMSGLYVEVHGMLASRRKNFSVKGIFSKKYRKGNYPLAHFKNRQDIPSRIKLMFFCLP